MGSGGVEHADFAAIGRGGFGAGKLAQCVKLLAQKNHLVTRAYSGKTLLVTKGPRPSVAAALDDSTAVFGSEKWVKKIIDLKRRGGKSSERLASLVKRADLTAAGWGVAALSDISRSALRAQVQSTVLSNVRTVCASLSLDDGVLAKVSLETSGAEEGKSLQSAIEKEIGEAKASLQMRLLGLSQYLDGLSISSEGTMVTGVMRLADQQVKDLIERTKALLDLALQPPAADTGSSGVPR